MILSFLEKARTRSRMKTDRRNFVGEGVLWWKQLPLTIRYFIYLIINMVRHSRTFTFRSSRTFTFGSGWDCRWVLRILKWFLFVDIFDYDYYRCSNSFIKLLECQRGDIRSWPTYDFSTTVSINRQGFNRKLILSLLFMIMNWDSISREAKA